MADHDKHEAEQPSLSVAHFVRTLRQYVPIITVVMAAVLIGYIIFAAAAYVLAPSQRVSSQAFRLDFKGADTGSYPSGVKFSSSEIIGPDVLIRVFNNNDLGRFTTYADFTSSIYVLESNAAYEQLVREYQARLSDPRLTAVDRERIAREYEMKRASLSKDQYSINYMRKKRSEAMPEGVVTKVLQDILREWARFAVNEQRVLDYPLAVLSPEVVVPSGVDSGDPVIQTQVLRAKVTRVLANIDQLSKLPAAAMARTKGDNMTLTDIRTRLDDIVRFRLDPLVLRSISAGLDGPATVRFLEAQLAYDQLQLDAQMSRAAAAREAMLMYTSVQHSGAQTAAAAAEARTPQQSAGAEPQTVMPQLTETFLDRLVNLTSNSVNPEYRRTLVEAFHQASLGVVPLQQAVAYDKEILALVRSAPGGGVSAAGTAQEIAAIQQEVRRLVMKVHEIYEFISRNLNPATHVLTVTSPVVTVVERAVSVRRLALYGILTLFIAFPLVVVGCLIHNRIREEETAEEEPYGHPAVTS